MRTIKVTILILFFINLISSWSYSNENLSNKIYKNLRCLVCQGQSIADSNSEFALTVKSVVNDKLKDGLSEKEVYEFLADKYGDWILYNPPLKEESYLLWLFPYVFFIIGAIVIFFLIKKSLKHKQ
jgi:cytochrome c-type biogenesis protein CcmH|tara:strand:- start:111 stop:488 length:378 start_codon:yes stop_codon:yes gene_type:complete